jgi:hypothetical protein
MPAPAGFSDLINRKYDIMQQEASDRGALEQAQAQQIGALTPSEIALRGAQTYATTQQGKSVMPLADASIAHTYQGEIPLAQAQTGYYGAQSNLSGAEAGYYGAQSRHLDWDNEPVHPFVQHQLYTGLSNKGYGLGGSTLQNPGGDPNGINIQGTSMTTMSPVDDNNASVTDSPEVLNAKRQRAAQGYHFAAGTPSVPPQGAHMKQPQAAPPSPMPPPGVHPLAHVVAHAMQALHAAGGATTVVVQPPAPAPGQTVTNGSWNPADLSGNTPNPNGQNQSLRRGLGMVKAAGGATNVQPQPTSPTPAGPGPGQTITNGTWGSPTPNQDLRKQLGMGVKAAGGATTINAKGGTAKVPGKGPPNVDSVPATLAPQEAVLNAGAAQHMGRGAIAMLNSLGAQKMAAQGMPPATPPSPNGTMGPARTPGRGMPPPKKAAPKPGAKGLPQKVAAKAGAK